MGPGISGAAALGSSLGRGAGSSPLSPLTALGRSRSSVGDDCACGAAGNAGHRMLSTAAIQIQASPLEASRKLRVAHTAHTPSAAPCSSRAWGKAPAGVCSPLPVPPKRATQVRCSSSVAAKPTAPNASETGADASADASVDEFSKLSNVCAVLGTQWGDEGKGKLVDILAKRYDVVCRCQVSRAFWELRSSGKRNQGRKEGKGFAMKGKGYSIV